MINRRDFMTGMTAGLAVCSQPLFLRNALASVVPTALATDPRRPQYHLLPAANWMNDPNGPIYWKGKYHMFYQYNPNGAYWGDMHWGHAVSPDMVHWRHLPVALAPTPGGPDAAGCFSGTAVVDGKRVAVLYTGVVSVPERDATIRDGEHSFRESQCLAISSDDDLTTWTKQPQPVIVAPPAGMDVSGFRDPSPWRQGDWWYMALGSGIRGKGGAVLLYRSRDLEHWEYLHFLAQGTGNGKQAANPVDSGDMWECPDFFPLGDKHVLIHSAEAKSFWQVGTFDTERLLFHPERSGVLDYGSFYAPKTQLDANGNRILWGWIPETRPLEEYRSAGWAGMMSLPRVLALDGNLNLQMRVAPAVKKLRQSPLVLKDQQQIAQLHIKNCCGEILCQVKPSNAFGLSILDSEEILNVQYDPVRADEIRLDGKPVPLLSGAEDKLELHFYVDGSVIETFINDRVAYTKRFYFRGATAPELMIRTSGKAESLSSLVVWQLSPVSPDRLTG
jgi:beta-fructofuranosidase